MKSESLNHKHNFFIVVVDGQAGQKENDASIYFCGRYSTTRLRDLYATATASSGCTNRKLCCPGAYVWMTTNARLWT